MSERATVVVPLFNELALTRACFESLTHTGGRFRVVAVDNGSTDGTRPFLHAVRYPFPLTVLENDAGGSVIASLNRAWPLVETEIVCFLHNDTEMVDPEWLAKLVGALDEPGVGLAGLYGAKRMRRDGRFVGRTIVHSLLERPTVSPGGEDVAVVDAVCLCVRRSVLEAVGGLDERFGFHGVDKDLSLAVRARGLRCRVVHAPFRHHGGGTRARDFAGAPERERRDLALRAEAAHALIAKWGHALPADARSGTARVREWLASRYPWRP